MGHAFVFGKNINTDLITPGRYNMSMNAAELAKICFVEYRPEFASGVRKGDFVVGAENFGCGSSRETAVMALKASGIRAILAKSFARIFYRNCMNQGLLAIGMDTSGISEGDELVLDDATGQLRNNTRNEAYGVELPRAMLTLEKEGGMVRFLRKNGFEALDGLFAD